MKLQNIIWPKDGMCTEEGLYYHTAFTEMDKVPEKDRENSYGMKLIEQQSNEMFNAQKVALHPEGGLSLDNKGHVSFDTYFNSVSIEKWKKYTKVKEVSVTLEYKGDIQVQLCTKQMLHNEVIKKVVARKELHSQRKSKVTLSFGNVDKGMLYIVVDSLADESVVYGGYYSDENITDEDVRDVHIGICICTFKRESYIEKNIKLLNENIIENPDSPLYGKLDVYISDNGQTLDIDRLSSDKIHIVKNKNTGGAGGFTRDLMEILMSNNKHGITHPLLMDDDIVIDPESLVKTYRILSLLKEEHKDAFIGGAMLRIDMQNIQVESGASWNAGDLISNKQNLDMNYAWNCLFNEIEEYNEYNAWWYCCFPISVVSDKNLPLPIFIRGDDLEYGLRNMKELILMNGICVWHEPFENKYSSFLEYYIIRNRLIDNAYHFPDWGKKELKKAIIGQCRRECKFYRYKNVDLHIQGVKDFLKGVKFFLKTDGEQLHKDIMAAGYKAVPVEECGVPFKYSKYDGSRTQRISKLHDRVRKLTYNGYFLPAKHTRIVSMAQATFESVWRAKTVVYYDVTSNKAFVCHRDFKEMVRKYIEAIRLCILVDMKYDRAKKDFQKNGYKIKNLEFWKNYLDLND